MARKPDVQYIRYVTDGSAARKAQPVMPKPKTRLPKVRKPKEQGVYRIDLLAITGIFLSLVMLALMVVSCFQLHDYQLKANAMDDYVDVLKEENNRLTDKYEDAVDLEAIENMALTLGLVPIEEVTHLSVAVTPSRETSGGQTTLLTDLAR